jgi:hypothetical protein
MSSSSFDRTLSLKFVASSVLVCGCEARIVTRNSEFILKEIVLTWFLRLCYFFGVGWEKYECKLRSLLFSIGGKILVGSDVLLDRGRTDIHLIKGRDVRL